VSEVTHESGTPDGVRRRLDGCGSC